MGINILEGGRRLSLVIITAIFLITFCIVFAEQRNPQVFLQIDSYNAAPNISSDCGTNYAGYPLGLQRSARGLTYDLYLCFKKFKSDSGKVGIPYLEDKGSVFYDSENSDLVRQYMTVYASTLILFQDERMPSDFAVIKSKAKDVFEAFGISLLAAVTAFLFFKTIGWIVKGFISSRP